MSHYVNTARNSVIIVHHTGTPNAHTSTTDYCPFGYDATVTYNGVIKICSRWSDGTGAHASGCNCNTMGIMLYGCFGGCPSGNISGPSQAQECSLAYLWSHMVGTIIRDRLCPHRRCHYWAPCASAGYTECCGNNLCSDSGTNFHWNSTGVALRNRVYTAAVSYRNNGRCS